MHNYEFCMGGIGYKASSLIEVGIITFFINLVRMFLMGGFSRSKPTLSEACCTGPDLNRPIGKFRVDGEI